MTREEIMDFIWTRIAKGNHYFVGPTGGLIIAPPIEKLVDWFIELQQKDTKWLEGD